MKKLFTILFVMAAAVMAFDGCTKSEPENNLADEKGATLVLVAGNQPDNLTRTQMNDEGNDVIWSNDAGTADEYLNFYCDGVFQNKTNLPVTQELDGNKIKFTLTGDILKTTTEIEGFFGAKYSKNAQYFDPSNNKKVLGFGIDLPATQNITTATFDKFSDALVMESVKTDFSSGSYVSVGIAYHRLFAITKLVFTGLDEYGTEKVSFVKFESAAHDLAGGVTYDYANKKYLNKDGSDRSVATDGYFTEAPSKTVAMNFSEQPCLDAAFAAWMVSAPVTFAEGEKVTVTIKTDAHTISKEITVPEGHSMTFKNTQGNKLTINMAGATVTGEAQYVYTEITSAAELVAHGEYLLLVTDSTTFCTGVLKSGRFLVTADKATAEGTVLTNVPEDAQVFTLVADETNYKLKFLDEEKYVSATAAKTKSFKIETEAAKAISWTFTPATDGWEILSSTQISEKTVKILVNQDKYFNTYASTQNMSGTGNQKMALPKIVKRTLQ